MADELQAGADYYNSLVTNARATNAYNALNKTYGPAIANDPVKAAQAASAEAETQNLPNVEAAQVAKAAALQSNIQNYGAGAGDPESTSQDITNAGANLAQKQAAQYRTIGSLLPLAQQDGSFHPDDLAPIDKDPAAAGIDPQIWPSLKARLQQPGANQVLSQYQQNAVGPQKYVGSPTQIINPDGTVSLVRQGDKGGMTAQNLGSGVQTPQEIAARTGQANAGAHGTEADAAAYIAGLGGTGGAPLGSGLTQPTVNLINGPGRSTAPPAAGQPVQPAQAAPVPRRGMSALPYSDGSGYAMIPTSSVPKAADGTQAVVNRATGQVEQRTVQMSQSPQAVNIARATVNQVDTNFRVATSALKSASDMVGSLNTGIGGRTIGELIPSQTEKLETYVDTAKAKIAVIAAQASRGTSGAKSAAIAVRNMAEFKAYQDAVGAINLHADAKTVRSQLANAQGSLADLQDAIHQQYSAQFGPGVLGTQAGWSIKAVP